MPVSNVLLAVPFCCLFVGAFNAGAADEVKTKPFGGKPHVIPGKIEAENFDRGKPQEAYRDFDEKNLGADYRGPTQVDIEKRPDASNGYGVGWTRKDEWLVYSVSVASSGTYEVEFPVASNKKGGKFHLELDGKDISGPIQVPDTGGWQRLKKIKKKGLRLKKGRYLLKMVMDSEGPSGSIGDIDYLLFTKQRNPSPQ